MLFEAWTIKRATPTTDPWPFHPMHPANNVNGIADNPILENGRAWDVFSLNCPGILHWQQEYVKKVLDTVNDLDNVLVEICNEIPNRPEALEWQEHLCAFVHRYESDKPKQHPVGITGEGGDQENADLFTTSADWISPGNGAGLEYRYNPPVADGRKVILNDTDHLWGHGAEVSWIWKSFTRGMNVLFMDPWEPLPADMPGWGDGDVPLNRRYYYLWDPVRRNLGYARRSAARLDLSACVPRPELCTSTYCLANPGREYLCYFPGGATEGVNLRGAAGRYAVEWFDPATDQTLHRESIRGERSHALRAPFGGPAVLYLCREEL